MARDRSKTTWFFDLDNTLHDASSAAFRHTSQAMSDYIALHLQIEPAEAQALRQRYWARYGATLLGLVRHHGISAAHFLEETHRLPGLEARLRTSTHDRAVLRRLPGRKLILTNAPRDYAMRVLRTLDLLRAFDGVLSIEDMTMFGQHRPKPDARMFRHVLARLGLRAADCVLVEDTLEHQKAARRIGMGTVWMQRWMRQGGAQGSAIVPRQLSIKPPYVDRRIHRLDELLRLRR
jgi:putative hydrolase of the HAD superfamily